MKKKQRQKVKTVKSNVDKTGGRKSKSSKELWARRVEELQLYSARVPLDTICQKYGISRQTLFEDIRALAELKDPLLAKQKILSGISLIIRKALGEGDLKVALASLELESKVEGLLRGDSINLIQQNLGTRNLDEPNRYDGWTDEELLAEWNRRKELWLRKGKDKEESRRR